MTRAQLNVRMALGVARPDLTADNGTDYTAILNDAQKEICRLHSFRFMKATAELAVNPGNTSVSLPANFKELTRSKSPVHSKDALGVQTPVDVWTMERLKRRIRSSLSTQIAVALDWDYTPPKLSLLGIEIDEPLTLVVSYYGFPSDLAAGSVESTALTTDFPEMLLAMAKMLAFAAVNDPMAADMEKLFQLKFRDARAHDCYAAIAGTDTHM
jgi:hypothetical protein